MNGFPCFASETYFDEVKWFGSCDGVADVDVAHRWVDILALEAIGELVSRFAHSRVMSILRTLTALLCFGWAHCSSCMLEIAALATNWASCYRPLKAGA